MRSFINKSLVIGVLATSALVVPAAIDSNPAEAARRSSSVWCRLDQGPSACKSRAQRSFLYQYGYWPSYCSTTYASNGKPYGWCV